MTRRLALIHTVGSLVPVFRDLTHELAPDVSTTDVVDEALRDTFTIEGQQLFDDGCEHAFEDGVGHVGSDDT